MWIERLQIEGFGCLHDQDVHFGERVTVVTGFNEAGKSTLHAAMLAAMFGFFDSADRRTQRAQEAERERFEPWSGASYGLTARIHLADGSPVRLRWGFSDRTRLTAHDDRTGADLSERFRDGGESVLAATDLWGLTREFYTRAFFVRQGELAALHDSDKAITKTFESLASSGGRDASAQRALELLARVRRGDIGTDRMRTAPLPRARSHRDGLAAELAEVTQRRADLESLAAERQAAEVRSDELRQRLETAEVQVDAHKAVTLRERLEAIDRTAAALGDFAARLEELEPVASFSADEASDVLAKGERYLDLLGTAEQREEEWRTADDAVKAATEDVANQEGQLQTLEPFVDAPTQEQATMLAGAVERLRGAQPTRAQEIVAPQPDGELVVLEAQIAKDRPERERLERGRESGSRSSSAALAATVAAICAAASVVVGVPIAALALAVIAGALALVWLLGGRANENDARLQALEDAKRRAEELRRDYERAAAEARGRIEERQARASAVEQERERAASEVAMLLREAGFDPQDGDRAIQDFNQAVAMRERRTRVETELERARNRLTAERRPSEERDRVQAETMQLRAQLVAAYERAGITNDDQRSARAAYEGRLAAHQRFVVARTERDKLDHRQSGLLSGRTLEQLRHELTQLEGRGALRLPAPSAEEAAKIANRLDQLRSDAREARDQERQLSGRLENALEELPPSAELEEQLAQATTKIESLEEQRALLEFTEEALERAADEAHKDFAPRLNAALGQSLALVTDGRYREAWVDDDYLARVLAPETNELVSVDLLSRGTQEQIYLIERLELIRLLSTKEPLPVLLDDPLTHCDEIRSRALARLLTDASEHQQMVILSTDASLAGLMEESCAGCVAIDLERQAALRS